MIFNVYRPNSWGKSPTPTAVRNEDSKSGYYWTIDIDSISTLMELVEKEGDIIVSKEGITIYADYIE